MKERFFELVRMLSKNPTEFAKSIEISGAVLSSIKSGRTDLSMMVVTRTKEKYKNVNLEWLFTGEGKPFLDEPSNVADSDTSDNETTIPIVEIPNHDNHKDRELPFVGEEVSMVEEKAATYETRVSKPSNDESTTGVNSEHDNVAYKPVMMVSQPEQPLVQTSGQCKRKISQIVIMYNDETYETLNKN